jgi:opacity protein-like surface antigen
VNKYVCIIILIAFVSLSYAQNSKMNIAVIDLDPTGISNNEAQFLSDRLRTELFETSKFQVVEREKMNTILQEQGFQQSGCTTVECAIEIGQLLNVTVMVAGSIGKIEEIYSLSIRMIDVQTGAILRTATRDYEGKLSEVLTDVIPEIAEELAEAESEDSKGTIEEEAPADEEKTDYNRWGILLKLGYSFLNYTKDINDAINELDPVTRALFDEISNHSNFGFELRYALSQRWKLKLGLGVENLTSPWKVSYNAFVANQQISFNFEREYQFVTTYIGANYSLWYNPNKYDIYLGLDIGSTLLNARTETQTVGLDATKTNTDESFEYSAFSWKFALGASFFLSQSFSLGLEMGLKGAGKFDISDQLSDEANENVGTSGELDSGGLQLVLFIGYHF